MCKKKKKLGSSGSKPQDRLDDDILEKYEPGPDPILLPHFRAEHYNKHFIRLHNEHRANHGCPPLKENPILTGVSKDWALHLAVVNSCEHRPCNHHGENLFFGQNLDIQPESAMEEWYGEKSSYNFRTPRFEPSAGHFTQVVWRETTDIGIGVATRGHSHWVVANYDPPGNVIGYFGANVPDIQENHCKLRLNMEEDAEIVDPNAPGGSKTKKKQKKKVQTVKTGPGYV